VQRRKCTNYGLAKRRNTKLTKISLSIKKAGYTLLAKETKTEKRRKSRNKNIFKIGIDKRSCEIGVEIMPCPQQLHFKGHFKLQ
jgi:hypothetical protein